MAFDDPDKAFGSLLRLVDWTETHAVVRIHHGGPPLERVSSSEGRNTQ